MKARKWYTCDPAFLSIEAALTSVRAAIVSVELADRLPPPQAWVEPPDRGAYPKPFVPTAARKAMPPILGADPAPPATS